MAAADPPLVMPEDEFALVRRIWALLEPTERDGEDAPAKANES